MARLDEPSFSGLLRSFENLQPTLSRRELVTIIESAIEGIPRDDADDLLSALISAATSRTRGSYSAKKFAEWIASSLELEAGEAETIKARLGQLLELDALSRVAKAIDVLVDNDRMFHDARVLSDVRPVFRADPPNPPEAAVMLHTLKIEYHDAAGNTQAAYFAMDAADIKRLQKVITRAVEKAEALHKFLSLVPMPLLEVEDDEEEVE